MNEQLSFEGLKYRIEILEKNYNNLDEKNSEAHQAIFSNIETLKIENSVNNERYLQIIAKLDKLTDNFEKMAQKPEKRWEKVITTVIAAIVSAVMAVIITGKL